MERENPPTHGISVLERIKKKTASLKEEVLVEYKKPGEVKKSFKKLTPPETGIIQREPRRPGRPKMEEELRTKDIRISLKGHLFREVEKRKETAKSRSSVLCELIDKGLMYENLRRDQAQVLKEHLKDFAETFAALKVRKTASSSWRSNQVVLEDNETALAKLYKKSLELKRYLQMVGINPASFEEVGEFLTKKEMKYLEFASVPERIGQIVKPGDGGNDNG